jgi:hypothetical protein
MLNEQERKMRRLFADKLAKIMTLTAYSHVTISLQQTTPRFHHTSMLPAVPITSAGPATESDAKMAFFAAEFER